MGKEKEFVGLLLPSFFVLWDLSIRLGGNKNFCFLQKNLRMHLEGTGIMELYWNAKPHRDFHQAIDKLIE
jgi:hypothetical protein